MDPQIAEIGAANTEDAKIRPVDDIYRDLLQGNERWVEERLAEDPEYFNNLARGQTPRVLWIGCSDSRVPANEITGQQPGEIFVHRNIANMVVHTDINLLSVLDYAVQVLGVRHVIVCGHYGCGGIAAAMSNRQFGLIDNWLRNIKDVYRLHQAELDAITDEAARSHRLSELSVIEQVLNLSKTSTVQNAWQKTQPLQLHGWIYDVGNGRIKDLGVNFKNTEDLASIYRFD